MSNQNSQLLNGSICLTDLIAQAKAGHSAFTKSKKNGKVYVNFSQWINQEKNEFKQNSSLLLNSTKEMRDAEGKVYFGNATISEYTPDPVSETDTDEMPEDFDVPVYEAASKQEDDDLPF